jgi:hypothetical protein
LSLLLAFALAAAPVRLPPIDQCAGDAGFAEFRTALTGAVEKRDIDALLGLMSDDVRVSFGGRYGKEQFREYWRSKPSGSDGLWLELSEALSLGCAVKGEARVFPSMFAQADDLDGFETWIAKPGARLRRAPNLGGAIAARLSWHVLRLDGQWNGEDWIPVRLADGRRGYVHQSAVRSPIDYRLIANRRGEGWRITAFVAGD